MRNEPGFHAVVGRDEHGSLSAQPLAGGAWDQAWRAFLDEDHEASLDLARRCLDQIGEIRRAPVALVPDRGAPTVKDCVVLCARNLFHLERFEDFEVLHASAARWGLVPQDMPELDVVGVAFACKRGDYRQVIEESTAFVEAHRHELPPVIAEYLYLRGQAWSALGDPDRALEDVEAAYAIFRVLGRRLDSARTANLLGVIAFRRAAYGEAVQWFERAHGLHEKLGMRKNMGGNRLNIGIAHYKLGAFRRSLTELRDAAAQLAAVNARTSLCRAMIATGNTLRLLRDFEGAREQLLAAYESANQLMLSREEALALEFLGDVCRDEDRLDQARRYYSRALAIGSSIAPDGDIVMEVLRRQAECLERMGRQAEAVPVLSRALALSRQLQDRFEEGVVRRVLAAAMLGLGDLDSAQRYANQAVARLREVRARHELALALLQSADIAIACTESGVCAEPAARLDEAWDAAMAALDLFLKMEVDHWILRAREALVRISALRTDGEAARRLIEASARRHGGGGRPGAELPIVHVSARMRDLIQLTDAFADSGEPVLVTGATGTGKELFARRLHHRSNRRAGELVTVNVSAIPASVFEREFFGHTRGAFTGADSDGVGLAARAHGGTLFLDEIGDLPLALQPRLLRLLQDGTYQAIGDPRERQADIRLVAATNADLKRLVAEGRFRADLYYRLRILELHLPLLRDRREDILPLLKHFLTAAAGGPVDLTGYFRAESLTAIQHYAWPGNVRELAMVARQAHVQLSSRGSVTVELGAETGEPLCLRGPQGAGPFRGKVVGRIAAPESGRSRILLALAETDGNRARAARRLGVSRSTLYRRMDKLGIAPKS